MGRMLVIVLSVAFVVGFAGTAFANVRSGDTYGPASMSGTDNGSCGNEWANDLWNRTFIVDPVARVVSGFFTYRITRWDRQGTFHTIAGTSPGACDTGPDNGSTVAGGIRGHFHGYVNYTATCPVASTDCYAPSGATTFMNTCSSDQSCTTDGFIAAAFPGATYESGSFKYVYTSRNASLCASKWIDQGVDGTSETLTGDIATTCTA
jgi:hypothetical protein